MFLRRCAACFGAGFAYLTYTRHPATASPDPDANLARLRELLPPPQPQQPQPPGPGFHVHVVAPEGVRTSFRILFLNVAVYVAWKLPISRLQYFMSSWFMTQGAARYDSPVSPLRTLARSFLSTYSHSSFLHLAANMLALLSFSPRCMDGRETVRTPKLSPLDFMAFYTAAGVAAGLGSTAFSSRLGTGRPGLGASGSIFGGLTYYALSYPDSRVLFLFVFEMSSETALAGATALNLFLAGKEYMAARGKGARAGRPPPPFFTVYLAAPPPSPPKTYPRPTLPAIPLPPPPFPQRTAGPPIMDGMAHLIGTAVGYAVFKLAQQRAARRKSESRQRAGGGGRGTKNGYTVTITQPPGGSVSV
jgi:membrane associated rhomboid family serine protease